MMDMRKNLAHSKQGKAEAKYDGFIGFMKGRNGKCHWGGRSLGAFWSHVKREQKVTKIGKQRLLRLCFLKNFS
jgi:hypothetical protein